MENINKDVLDKGQQGIKLDSGKPRYDLLSPQALSGLVDVLTCGAIKYPSRNWEKGISFGRVFAALMRHLWRWWAGEEKDPESKKSHLDHAQACLHFLSHYKSNVRYNKFDDRPKQPKKEIRA